MAGIGFRLKKTLMPGTFASALKGYGYAALISSGPWIVSIVSLAVLGVVLSGIGYKKEMELFFVSITHIYGFSLILTGPFQMILTRYAADQHYLKQERLIFPSLISALASTSLIAGALSLPAFLFLMEADLIFQLSSSFFFVILCCVWMTSVFLTSLKNYNAVLISFAIGYAVSFAAAWAFTLALGPQYTMLGYVLGQVLLLLMFIRAVHGHFGNSSVKNFAFLSYFKTHAPLALVGLFYNLGMWADKIIYWWFSPMGEPVSRFFRSAPVYDAAVYLSFLSIVPGMAVFLIKLETDYAERYELFLEVVLNQKPLGEIENAKWGMVGALQGGLKQMIKLQGLVTAALILFAEDILGALDLGALQTGVFQVTLLGVFLLVIFLSLMTVLFYLDQIRAAMWCCVCFAAVNILVTSMNVAAAETWYGTGFVAAAAAALLLSAHFVNRNHDRLEFNTFAPQKIA